MKTKLYIVRHGESLANEKDMYIGQTDLGLSEKGKKQAKKTAEYLMNFDFDVLISSDLLRTVQTAEPIANIKKLEIIKTKGLREIFGGEWENRKISELMKKYPEEYGIWRKNIGESSCVGGENVANLQARIKTEFERIVSVYSGKRICVVTHATPIRAMAALWTGKTLSQMKDFSWASNDSVTFAEYENGKFVLLEYGHDEHLEELRTKPRDTVKK